jgi:hypothetical protein
MLSEREQRALDVIEHGLASGDPRFAASMRRAGPTWAERWAPWGYDALVVLAAAAAVTGLVLGLPGAAARAVVVVVVMCRLRPLHFRPWFRLRRIGLRRMYRWDVRRL